MREELEQAIDAHGFPCVLIVLRMIAEDDARVEDNCEMCGQLAKKLSELAEWASKNGF